MAEISEEELLYQLYCIATADATMLMQVKDGGLTVADTDGLSREIKAAVSSVEKSAGGIKIKLYDKLKALELLGKYLGLFDGRGQQPKPENPLLVALLQEGTNETQQQAEIGAALVE